MNSTTQVHSVDRMLRLLADEQRRTILRHLMENSENPTTVEELAIAITDGDLSFRRGGDASEQITIQLHHTHLPRLADGGPIDYDPRTRTVRYWSDDLVEGLLRTIETAQ